MEAQAKVSPDFAAGSQRREKVMRPMKMSPRTALALQALLLMGLALIAAIAAADRPNSGDTVRAAGAAPGIAGPAAPQVPAATGATVGGTVRA